VAPTTVWSFATFGAGEVVGAGAGAGAVASGVGVALADVPGADVFDESVVAFAELALALLV